MAGLDKQLDSDSWGTELSCDFGKAQFSDGLIALTVGD